MAIIDPAVRKRGIAQESREHPTLPKRVVTQLVDDHLAEYGAKAYPPKHRKRKH